MIDNAKATFDLAKLAKKLKDVNGLLEDPRVCEVDDVPKSKDEEEAEEVIVWNDMNDSVGSIEVTMQAMLVSLDNISDMVRKLSDKVDIVQTMLAKSKS
ncbi:MAG: hypothetical protein PHN45_00850 [Methylococcales bacterium]|nr:hypothetical protein [Methylococcales bacterium]